MSSSQSMLASARLRGSRTEAYSLIELLVVVAIIGLMMALAAPVFIGITKSYELESASQMIANQVTQARQTALTRNHAVQVWLCQVPDEDQPNGPPIAWRVAQSFIEGDPTLTKPLSLSPLGKAVHLPRSVTMSTSGTFSPLIPSKVLLPGSGSTFPLPIVGRNFNYVVLRIRGDGSCDLAVGQNALTLISTRGNTPDATALSRDFVTLCIDPVITTVQSFRP